MKRAFRDLVLWIAVIGSFTVSITEPSLRWPAMFFVFVGITVMVLRRRRRNPDDRPVDGTKAERPRRGEGT